MRAASMVPLGAGPLPVPLALPAAVVSARSVPLEHATATSRVITTGLSFMAWRDAARGECNRARVRARPRPCERRTREVECTASGDAIGLRAPDRRDGESRHPYAAGVHVRSREPGTPTRLSA